MKNSINAINLIIRFILEVLALFIFGFYGWVHFHAPYKFSFVALFPIMVASIWGIFNVPIDPSRSGKAHIIV